MQINKSFYDDAEKNLRAVFKASDRSHLIMALRYIRDAEKSAQTWDEEPQTIAVIDAVAKLISCAKFRI